MIKFLSKVFGEKKKKKKKSPKAKLKKAKPVGTGQAPNQIPEQLTEQAPVQSKDKTAVEPNALTIANSSPTSERGKLIQNALAIHREKSKLLDNLPPAIRAKLTAMAMAIYIKKRPDNKNN